MAIPPNNAGIPTLRNIGYGPELQFDRVDYPGLDAARSNWTAAHDRWEAAVDPHPQLRNIHDNIKGRVADSAQKTPVLFQGQGVVLGGAGVPENAPGRAFVDELKAAYATHVPQETIEMLNASKAMHEHNALLYSDQLDIVKDLKSLPGVSPENFTAAQNAFIARHEQFLRDAEAILPHIEQYLPEIPLLARAAGHVPPPAGHAPPPEPPAGTRTPPPAPPRAAEPPSPRVGEAFWVEAQPERGHFESRALFLDGVHPELDQAQAKWHEALDKWHIGIAGDPATGVPRNETLARFHNKIKLNHNLPLGAPEPRAPFWSSQSTIGGTLRRSEPDSYIVGQLRKAYIKYAGADTVDFVNAAKEYHDHLIPIETERLQYLENATELLGYQAFATPEGKALAVDAQRRYLQTLQDNNRYITEFQAQIPGMQEALAAGQRIPTNPARQAPPPPAPPHNPGHGGGGGYGGEPASHAATAERTIIAAEQAEHGAAGTVRRTAAALEHTHSKNNMVAAGILAAGFGAGLVGYLMTQRGQSPAPKKNTGEPMKVDTVQLGAEQKPAMETPQWTSSASKDAEKPEAETPRWKSTIRTEPNDPSSSLSK